MCLQVLHSCCIGIIFLLLCPAHFYVGPQFPNERSYNKKTALANDADTKM